MDTRSAIRVHADAVSFAAGDEGAPELVVDDVRYDAETTERVRKLFGLQALGEHLTRYEPCPGQGAMRTVGRALRQAGARWSDKSGWEYGGDQDWCESCESWVDVLPDPWGKPVLAQHDRRVG